MARTKLPLFATLVLALCSTTAVQAQDGRRDPGNVRFFGGLWLGFGGDLELEVDALGNNLDFDAELTTTIGGQLGVDFVLHRHVALGLGYRIGAFNTEQGDDDDVDRSKLHDIVLMPRVRYPLAGFPLELYLSVPVGLTIARLSDELPGVDNIDERVGWNLGVGVGATYFVVPQFGVNLEPVWLMHQFKADGPFGVDGTYTAKQFNLLLNLVFAL
jgi:hypothetical protein